MITSPTIPSKVSHILLIVLGSILLSGISFTRESYEKATCVPVSAEEKKDYEITGGIFTRPTICRNTLQGWPHPYYYSDLEGKDAMLRRYDVNQPQDIATDFLINTAYHLVLLLGAYALYRILKKQFLRIPALYKLQTHNAIPAHKRSFLIFPMKKNKGSLPYLIGVLILIIIVGFGGPALFNVRQNGDPEKLTKLELKYYCKKMVDSAKSDFYMADPTLKPQYVNWCIQSHGRHKEDGYY